MDLRALEVQLATLVREVTLVLGVSKVTRDHVDLLVRLDRKDHKASKGCVACQAHQDRLDHLAPLALSARQAHRVPVVAMALSEREARQDLRVTTDPSRSIL
jgi:hypothetical protein